jgi:hypothetical protein
VKFIRQFAIVVLVVAIIVAGAVVWAHASGTSGASLRVPPPRVLEKFARIRANELGGRPDTGLHLSNTNNLIRTGLIEAALAAFVITINAISRQRHRMKRIT